MSRNLGQLVGGGINLSRNIHNLSAGGIATSTFLFFIAIEACGFPISLLISKPHQVRRADGSIIVLAADESIGLKEEVKLVCEWF